MVGSPRDRQPVDHAPHGEPTPDGPAGPACQARTTRRRKLTRSTTDKHVWGVAGGLGRYFGIDPVHLPRRRSAPRRSSAGSASLAYLALAAFLPKDDGEPAWIEGRSRVDDDRASPPCWRSPRVTTLSAAGVPARPGPVRRRRAARVARARRSTARSAAAAAATTRRGDRRAATLAPARAGRPRSGAATGIGFIAAIGGGSAVAVIAIFAGLGLIAAGLLGGPRWLILPVIVLVLPLAVVSAADIDLRGGVGERSLPADLRRRPAPRVPARRRARSISTCATMDAARRARPQVNVQRRASARRACACPRDACVTTDGEIGVGAADLPERADEGVNLDIDQLARQSPAGRGCVVNGRRRRRAPADRPHPGSACA